MRREAGAGEGTPPGPGDASDPLRAAFEVHYARLLRLCLLLTGRMADAEDLTQEAFVRAARRIPDLPVEAVGPYLRRAAINLWKNRLRRMGYELKAGARLGRPTAQVDPEVPDEVWDAVRGLPARQRACVVLRYYEDLSEAETSRVLACSVGTVKSQTSRALARLREKLSDER